MPSLQFKGKSIVENHHLSVPYKTLVPDAKKSLTKKISLDDNLVIHGDNLEALKSLLPSHAGRVKCIYIDPPYNTGEEGWKYNDAVNSPMMQEWLKQNAPVEKDDLTRHDKWLCMMVPRLRLLRELLSDDGTIFVSIDDNEQQHLRTVMDEIFGENCFQGCITWESRTKPINSGKARFQLQQKCEYVLCFSKKNREEFNGFLLNKVGSRDYPDQGKHGPCRLVDIEDSDRGGKARQTMKFPILGIRPAPGKRWKIGAAKAKQLLEKDRLVVVGGKVRKVIYHEDEGGDVFAPFWSHFSAEEYGTA